MGDSLHNFWLDGDGVTRVVAAVLLLMSVIAWVLIVWKVWVLRRSGHDLERAIPAFWAAESWDTGQQRLGSLDREGVIAPLARAAAEVPRAGSLEGQGDAGAQLTRRLRDALHRGLRHLQFGQVMLASIGSTAPFIGLFGTVWGIYHALTGLGQASSLSIDKVSGPVGEALIMTAAGLAVAIPAVLAYNLFGKWIAAREADLEGFAHDLREFVLDSKSIHDKRPGEQP